MRFQRPLICHYFEDVKAATVVDADDDIYVDDDADELMMMLLLLMFLVLFRCNLFLIVICIYSGL